MKIRASLEVSSANTAVPPIEIELRDYQKRMVAEIYSCIWQECSRIVAIAIMGAGKTVIAAWIMRDAVQKGRKSVFLVALNVLLDQTAETLKSLGVHCTILQGDRPVDASAPIIVASLQTISARLHKGKSLNDLLGHVDLILLDEAHITSFNTTYEIVQAYFSRAIVIGLTATPWRLSRKQWLGQRFERVVEGPQPPEIIKLGGAVPCRGFSIGDTLDLDTLNVRNGEYIDSEIAAQACRDEALEHVANEWLRLCNDLPTLMVGATVHQAEMTCDRFNQRGITAELIVGSTPEGQRLAIFERVRRGQTKVICSVGCLTAGFNLPCISAVLYVRATKSKALFHQTAGRGSRPHPGKSDYLLLDFGGNLKRHGNPMSWQDYSIDEPKQVEIPDTTKTCLGCNAEISKFTKVCPECGYEFTNEQPEEEPEELVIQQLSEYADPFTRQKIKNLRQWKKEAYYCNRSPDGAIEHFLAEYGHNPPAEWMRHACLTKRYSQRRKAQFVDYLLSHCKVERRWSQKWISHHLTIEFGTADTALEPWWEILELPPEANWENAKLAYARKMEELHPDRYREPDAEYQRSRLDFALEDARAERSEAVEVQANA